MTRCLVVVNPAAGRGHAMEAVRSAFERSSLDVLIEATTHAGHGTELSLDAGKKGYDLVVAAGGDGTIHEVVNGLLFSGQAAAGRPALGILPLGSGCDYAKTFEVPERIDEAVSLLAADRPPRIVDAGECVYKEGKRFFVNIAEVGIGPETVARAAKLPKALGPAMYGVAFCIVLPIYKRREAHVEVDSQIHGGPLTNLVVAVAQVFGGGMRVAPSADPSDGLFDVQIHSGSKIDYVRGLPKVYKGTHLPHPRIREERGAVVRVDCVPDALIEADGEVLGHTPASFTTLPAALRLKV